jgi:hypothetical protein
MPSTATPPALQPYSGEFAAADAAQRGFLSPRNSPDRKLKSRISGLKASDLNVEAIYYDFERATFGSEVVDHAFADMALNFEATAYGLKSTPLFLEINTHLYLVDVSRSARKKISARSHPADASRLTRKNIPQGKKKRFEKWRKLTIGRRLPARLSWRRAANGSRI